MIHFLIHDNTDSFGVAVVDLKLGTDCIGRNLADNSPLKARVEQDTPQPHPIRVRPQCGHLNITGAEFITACLLQV